MTPYIQPSEQADYNVADATAAQLASASRVFDSLIGRPEGLIWMPDFNGAPACMANLTPTLSYPIVTVAPGAGVVLTLPYGRFGAQSVGEVVILDRAGACESCVVAAASGNTITLANVQQAHAGVTLEFGLTIAEDVSGRVRLSRSPVATILSAFGRYGYDREMRNISRGFDDFEALLVTNYGTSGVSAWNQLDTTLWDLNGVTGVVRMPPHPFEAFRVRYVAGWGLANLPGPVKQCVANITRTMIDADIPANVKSFKDGDATIVNFNSSLIDADTRAMAQPYRSVRI